MTRAGLLTSSEGSQKPSTSAMIQSLPFGARPCSRWSRTGSPGVPNSRATKPSRASSTFLRLLLRSSWIPPHSVAHLASCATPLNSVPQCHTGVGKHVQPVTSGNYVPAPWTIKGSRAGASCHPQTRPSWRLAESCRLLPSSVALCPSPLLPRLGAPSCPSSIMLAFG